MRTAQDRVATLTQLHANMTRKKRRLKVAVIGCGAIGRLHAQAICQSEHAELVAVCDRRLKQAQALAQSLSPSAACFADDRQMLASQSLDAVFVATPDLAHVEPVVDAFRAGCHVFCEKPLAYASADAQKMVAAAKRARRHLSVDYNRRFGFGYQKVRELIDAGRLGKIQHALLHVIDGPPKRYTTPPFSLLKILMSHHIDLLRWYCGEVRSVSASLHSKGKEERVVDASLTLEFASGAIGTLTGGWRRAPHRTVEQMRIIGSEGVCRVEDVMGLMEFWRRDPDDVEVARPNYFQQGNRFYDSLASHVESFLIRLAQGKAPLVCGADGVEGLRIVEAAIESNRRGRKIKLQ
jgi:predicted dehydrogenase